MAPLSLIASNGSPQSLIASNGSPQSLIVWQQCGTFNGHGNFVSLGCYT